LPPLGRRVGLPRRQLTNKYMLLARGNNHARHWASNYNPLNGPYSTFGAIIPVLKKKSPGQLGWPGCYLYGSHWFQSGLGYFQHRLPSGSSKKKTSRVPVVQIFPVNGRITFGRSCQVRKYFLVFKQPCVLPGVAIY